MTRRASAAAACNCENIAANEGTPERAMSAGGVKMLPAGGARATAAPARKTRCRTARNASECSASPTASA
eukprot:scaffold34982_cov27-Tisochrysis_lutea.AAC.3